MPSGDGAVRCGRGCSLEWGVGEDFSENVLFE